MNGSSGLPVRQGQILESQRSEHPFRDVQGTCDSTSHAGPHLTREGARSRRRWTKIVEPAEQVLFNVLESMKDKSRRT
jgi:hypothetical protein